VFALHLCWVWLIQSLIISERENQSDDGCTSYGCHCRAQQYSFHLKSHICNRSRNKTIKHHRYDRFIHKYGKFISWHATVKCWLDTFIIIALFILHMPIQLYKWTCLREWMFNQTFHWSLLFLKADCRSRPIT